MTRTGLLQGVGALCLVGSSIALWFAFQRQLCTMVGGGPNSCAPNVAYLVPGVLAAIVGIALVTAAYRRRGSEDPPIMGIS